MQWMYTRFFAVIALWMSLAMHAHAQTRQLCFVGNRIVKVNMGAIQGTALGNDDGNAVYFLTESGMWYSLNNTFNMNDSRGIPLVRLLLIAKSTGMKITGLDSYPPFCNDIDTIHLSAG
jgi:hypothetical protein